MQLQPRRAFTIVELLIVIVIIALLATLGRVSWSGAQQRARNAQTAEAVTVYKAALESYQLEYGKYPTSSNSDQKVCLGQDYPSNRCWQSGIDSVTEDDSFMTALKSVHKDVLPMPATPAIAREGAIYEGIRSGYNNVVDGKETAFLVYSIEGDGPCPVGPVVSMPDTSQVFTYTSDRPASGVTKAKTSTEPALCYLQLSKAN